MDKDTRNRIQRATQAARRLLEEEFGQQLEGTYDIHLKGTLPEEPGTHLSAEERQIRARIAAAVEHLRDSGMKAAEAVQAYRREAAFTTVNRFVALKMLEARDLVRPSVTGGELSSGFREFCGLAPGLAQLPDHGYRLYIECLFDEIGTEVQVLFDRRDPASTLWPRQPALAALLEILNDSDLDAVWGADETLGWVYQYFNGEDERKQMRSESGAPRNSRELAVRNQFFTPRYVVEFLTDNTLGRMWCDMCQGETALAERCRYLVRHASEIYLPDHGFDGFEFELSARRLALGEGWRELSEEADWRLIEQAALALDGYGLAKHLEKAEGHGGTDALAALANGRLQEFEETGNWRGNSFELWMCLFFEQRRHHHFGEAPEGRDLEARLALYRAWREALQRESEESNQQALLNQPTYLRTRMAKDPRDLKLLDPACGSMHFGLYAFDLLEVMYQEAWEGARTPASALTGRTLRDDYPELAALRAAVPGLILRHNLHGIDIDPRAVQIAALTLWMRAQRAYGEGGIRRGERPRISRTNVVLAEPMPGDEGLRREFVAELVPKLGDLVTRVFEAMQLAGDMGSLLRIEEQIASAVRQVYGEFGGFFRDQDVDRWAEAESALLTALQDYAARADARASVSRRLFAEDAARGLAFIDLCRRKYDVVLMNPPFGAGSSKAKAAFEKAYPRTKNDVYAAFVERGIQLLHKRGLLGAITSRTGFFLSSFQKWREEILLKEAPPTVFADLGYGVLDSAMVEVAAYCLEVAE